jgi:Polyketide cyclase / dehydrase and lipid transport
VRGTKETTIPTDGEGSTIDERSDCAYIDLSRQEEAGWSRAGGTGMNEFELEITIDRPVDAVWSYFQDFSKEVRQTSAGPIGVGATLVFVGKLLGRNYESHSECTAYVPNERFATRTTSGPFLLEVDSRLEAVDGGTRMTSTYRGENHGFMKLAEPVAIRVARKQFEAANENLKALLEAEPVPA